MILSIKTKYLVKAYKNSAFAETHCILRKAFISEITIYGTGVYRNWKSPVHSRAYVEESNNTNGTSDAEKWYTERYLL